MMKSMKTMGRRAKDTSLAALLGLSIIAGGCATTGSTSSTSYKKSNRQTSSRQYNNFNIKILSIPTNAKIYSLEEGGDTFLCYTPSKVSITKRFDYGFSYCRDNKEKNIGLIITDVKRGGPAHRRGVGRGNHFVAWNHSYMNAEYKGGWYFDGPFFEIKMKEGVPITLFKNESWWSGLQNGKTIIPRGFISEMVLLKKDGYEDVMVQINDRNIDSLKYTGIIKRLVMDQEHVGKKLIELIDDDMYSEAEVLRQQQMAALMENPSVEHRIQLRKLEQIVGLDNKMLMGLKKNLAGYIIKKDWNNATKVSQIIEKMEARYYDSARITGESRTQIIQVPGSSQQVSTQIPSEIKVQLQQKPYYERGDAGKALRELHRSLDSDLKPGQEDAWNQIISGLTLWDVLSGLGEN